MRNVLIIIRRELGAYFNSAIAYIYLIVFTAINNSLFMTRYFLDNKADMTLYFSSLHLMLFIFIPVITMRLWAEDKKENTFELLLTFPMKPQELVLGKFFASLIFYSISLLSTIAVPIVVGLTGRPDPGAIVGGYIGLSLAGALFLAIGIFMSGLVTEQIIAFVLTTLSCFGLFFIGLDFIASFLDGWVRGLGTFLMNYVGVASHLRGFTKGVIDIKDIIYFAAGSFVFLLLNGFFLEGRLRPKSKLVFSAAVACSLIGLVIFNWLVHDIPVGRFDITEDKIYTVSDSARNIFKALKAPVMVNFYVTPSEKMPTAFKNLEQDIRGKLEELKLVSGNKFNYKIYHIEASKLLEDNRRADEAQKEGGSLEKTLQEKGIVPYQVESIDKDEVGLKLVYSAMSVSYKEKQEEILPRILPQNLPDLEYIIFSRIMKLTREKKPKIALFSPLKTEDLTSDMNRLLSGMGQGAAAQYEDLYRSLAPLMRNNGYDVQRISLTETDPMPADIDTLLIFNTRELSDRQLFEINKFLYRGGSACIADQAFEYSLGMVPPDGLDVTPVKLNVGINKLIEKWGVGINEEMLMDESNEIIQITSGQRVGPFALSMPVKLANQVDVTGATMNKMMPFMMRLPSFFYMWGSSLDISDDIAHQAGLKKTVMFTSSGRSWKVPYSGGKLRAGDMEYPKSGSEGKYPLGVMLEGQFTNTFKDGELPGWAVKKEEPKPAKNEEAKKDAAKKEEKKADMDEPKPGRLIVIGCSKIFQDDLLANAGNLSLFSNIIDGLTLGNDIIKVRSGTYYSRELKKISDSRKILYRFVTILLVPILLVCYAAARFFLRRKEKQYYLEAKEKQG
ncbi:MAG: Gldg family protein [Candidatus Omnitrophota bacterium]